LEARFRAVQQNSGANQKLRREDENLFPATANAGEGDRATRGGGGVGIAASLSLKEIGR
jgi:hypothetical protein